MPVPDRNRTKRLFVFIGTRCFSARHMWYVMPNKKSRLDGIIKALGLVFGDIGTSPIYTLTVIFILTNRTEANVIGVLSLIVWTLVTLVTIQYAWLATGISKHGQGGPTCLQEI